MTHVKLTAGSCQQTLLIMNFIFFSPHFPQNSTEFCFYLKEAGVNVLGIGDAEYNSLSDRLRYSLTEYYKVSNMEDYEQILKAVGYFTHKYGKIDRFDSLNEYWLEIEAKIRTDFNIYGTKSDFIHNLKLKSKMKTFFDKSGVNTVRCFKPTDLKTALNFIETIDYPLVVKPDQGSGASMTYKIENESAFHAFFNSKPANAEFIIEEFVDGIVLTYDGLIDRSGKIVFENSHRFEQSIMEVVNSDDNLYYICLPDIDHKVKEAGRSILGTFDAREKFFHIEFFERRTDKQIVALEVNMRPPGAWMTDAINYSHDINVYKEWANMILRDDVIVVSQAKYFTGYASRKNRKNYRNSHEQILENYRHKILHFNHIEQVFSRAMGDFAYQFRSDSYKEVKEIINYIQS